MPHKETWEQRRRRLDGELEKKLNRQMVPIMLPMVIAAGFLIGVIITYLFIYPFARELVGIFMAIAAVTGFGPIGFMMWKYR